MYTVLPPLTLPRLTRIRSFAIFKSRRFVFCLSATELDYSLSPSCSVIEELVDLARQVSLKVDGDDVQELLDSHQLELTIYELKEMYGQE
ncbi:hypothetical protein TNCV_4640091 [Trichonephila clavipes]|nr:hypothetical protein TNCV_4640091 [Trichonephila clavipes]